MSTAVGLLVLVGVLAFAVVRPRGLPEAVAAVPGAVLLLAVGAVTAREAGRESGVRAHLADEHGVFGYAGALVGRAARGSARGLLRLTFVAAAVVTAVVVVTAVLSLDATNREGSAR